MKKKNTLTDAKIKEIWGFYEEFRENPLILKMQNIKQHRTSNTYRHLCLVCEESIKYAIKKNLDIDYFSLIRGSLLHDLFLYDWRKDKSNRKHHLLRHPLRAYTNAKKVFKLNKIEKDIILNHMWPITLLHFPKTKEGKIVMLIDKKVTFQEVFNKKNKLLIFDLDGTLVDSVKDLNEAVNYACTHFNLPKRSLEQTRKDIGNGVAKLIARSIPNNENNEQYKDILNVFKEYYASHSTIYTKPYEGMKETLTELKRIGYRLAVVTNKVDNIAKDIIKKYYPNIFDYVLGDTPSLRNKPSSDMVDYVKKTLKASSKNIIYIGDTEVDWQTANNSKTKSILVSYGYRTKEELLSLCPHATIIDNPRELLNLLLKK